jgi:hypothetical protein
MVKIRAHTENALRAHCHRLDNVASCADARVEEYRQVAFLLCLEDLSRLHDLGERVQGANGAVDLPSTVIRHDDPVNAQINSFLRILV